MSSKLQQFIDDKWLFNSFDLSTKPIPDKTYNFGFNIATGGGDLFDYARQKVFNEKRIAIDVFLPKKSRELDDILEGEIPKGIHSVVAIADEFYTKNTNGKLRFFLRKEQRAKNIPIDYLQKNDAIAVAVLEQDSPWLAAEYRSNGIIFMFKNAFVKGLAEAGLILSHELGHGIFGYGHHTPPRGCIMDFSSALELELCFAEQQKLESLVRGVHVSRPV